MRPLEISPKHAPRGIWNTLRYRSSMRTLVAAQIATVALGKTTSRNHIIVKVLLPESAPSNTRATVRNRLQCANNGICHHCDTYHFSPNSGSPHTPSPCNFAGTARRARLKPELDAALAAAGTPKALHLGTPTPCISPTYAVGTDASDLPPTA